MNSLWKYNIEKKQFSSLNKDIKTDILIIGGGMAGILCAYFLHQSGADYVLVEGNSIGNGITGNTTAKITSQHGLIYTRLLKETGKEKAGKYLKANELALLKYSELSEKIDCDFERKNAFVYSLNDRKAIEKEVSSLEKLNFHAKFKESVALPFKIAGAVEFKTQAQFNPMKFITKISENLNIYEYTYVKELNGTTAITDNGKIKANKIIVATHFPFINKQGSYFLKMYQHRSYVIALENAPDVGGMYLEEVKNGLSFRNYNNMLIIGGGDHKTGKAGGNWEVLRSFAKNTYSNAKELFHWAVQDCETLDGIPYIGKYSKSTKGLYVATGFNKWGMTSSMVAAMILTDMIIDKKNEFADVFSPSRNMMKPQLFLNGLNAVVNLFTPSTKRCPHMGCALKWNKAERTWDCPCHGSRFEESGKLIDNPATGDLKK